MGKYSQGILGPFSGKVGSVVGSSWKGVNYIKSLPGPNTSNTEKQQEQRSRFKSVVKMASLLLATLIRPVWNLSSGRITGYNLFVKTNINAFDQDGDLVNHSDFHASVGTLALPSGLAIQDDVDVSSGIIVSWINESGSGIGNNDDDLHLVVVKYDEIHVLHPRNVRSDQSAELTLPVSPGTVHIYAYFGKANGSQFSTDSYQEVILT